MTDKKPWELGPYFTVPFSHNIRSKDKNHMLDHHDANAMVAEIERLQAENEKLRKHIWDALYCGDDDDGLTKQNRMQMHLKRSGVTFEGR